MMNGVQTPDDAPSPEAILAAFGVGGRATAMVPVAGAWSNRVYRLSTDLGSYAVKELLNPWRQPSWLDSLYAAWRFELAAQAAGVAIPVPVPSPSGGCVAWVERQGRAGPVPVRLHAWVEGPAGACARHQADGELGRPDARDAAPSGSVRRIAAGSRC